MRGGGSMGCEEWAVWGERRGQYGVRGGGSMG